MWFYVMTDHTQMFTAILLLSTRSAGQKSQLHQSQSISVIADFTCCGPEILFTLKYFQTTLLLHQEYCSVFVDDIFLSFLSV